MGKKIGGTGLAGWARNSLLRLAAEAAVAVLAFLALTARVEAIECTNGALAPSPAPQELLVHSGTCTVGAGTYYFTTVNIYSGGKLWFENNKDAVIDFYASGILVENTGSLVAGVDQDGVTVRPIGADGGKLTIHLYGQDQNSAHAVGMECKTPTSDQQTAPCGIPDTVWNNSGQQTSLPGGVTDYFYQYMPLPLDDGDPKGFFGYKVLGVSYGGTLQLFGKKGATSAAEELNQTFRPKDSARSWRRLDGTITPGATKLKVDRPDLIAGNWQVGDHIVVTTTDYLPGHSEELVIDAIDASTQEITFTAACYKAGTCTTQGVQWTHNGVAYPLSRLPARLNIPKTAAETRAAVALLTRDIRIVSEGETYLDPFYAPTDLTHPNYSFGGHVVARQGFQKFQVWGVEFRQLGQGGRLGHYPVHFHMARQTPADTFVKDSSINESMTRWITVHATQGTTLARNVGYLSIGHGFYLEDAVETNNRLYSNLGIFARAGVANAANPRNIPGILAAPDNPQPGPSYPNGVIRYITDIDQPAVFWITNGWNDFQGNMAAGAGFCGVCYWEIPAAISGPSRGETWESYAGEQSDTVQGDRTGSSPLMTFDGNYCTSAMMSFQTVGYTQNCPGVGSGLPAVPVPNPNAPASLTTNCGPSSTTWPICPNDYYPQLEDLLHQATTCPETGPCDEAHAPICSNGNETNCVPTVINDYTTSFNYAQTNFAGIWLRSRWHLISNSFISDVQNAGLSFISGGDYTHSSAIIGLWELALKDVFVGQTQPDNGYNSVLSPFNATTGLTCDSASYCISPPNSFTLGGFASFANNERMFSIYDGPAYEDSNAYLDITRTDLGTTPDKSVYRNVLGIPRAAQAANNVKQGDCYIPNAAIAWKQPNGFYYPPTFHSNNLFFDNVDIRHFVIDPQWKPNTYITDPTQASNRYCTSASNMFDNFSAIDRQTELTDDDGSLTGYSNTISVNVDPFFSAPIEGIQCASDTAVPESGTASTSPYGTELSGYVTSVVYPECAKAGGTGCSQWDQPCSNEFCFGVPLYREYLTGTEDGSSPKPTEFIRMAGSAIYQRETMTVNHGHYYIDTTASVETQEQFSSTGGALINVFQGGQTYDVFLVYATENTEQTYDMYVGPDCNPGLVKLIRVNIDNAPFVISPGTGGDQTTLTVACKSSGSGAGNDILEVTLNLSAYKGDYDSARINLCAPQTVCQWDGTKCVGKPAASLKSFRGAVGFFAGAAANLAQGNSDPFAPLTQAERDQACSYAGRDVDCPTGGCVGFSVTMPSSFVADDQTTKQNLVSPLLACFPSNSTWDFTPAAADAALAGTCYKAPMTRNFCSAQ